MQRTVAAESVFSSKARKFLPVLPKLQISAHNGGGIHRFSDPLQYLHAVNAVRLKVDIFSYANHAVAANPLCISVSKSLSLPIKTSTFFIRLAHHVKSTMRDGGFNGEFFGHGILSCWGWQRRMLGLKNTVAACEMTNAV